MSLVATVMDEPDRLECPRCGSKAFFINCEDVNRWVAIDGGVAAANVNNAECCGCHAMILVRFQP